MWKDLLTIVKQLFSVAKETQQNKADVKDLRERLKERTQRTKNCGKSFGG